MNQCLSDKIKVISFFSIILVLYIHSGFHQLPHEIEGMKFNYYLQESISGVVGRCAVPIFFAISGYLFFLNVDSTRDVYRKMKKRVSTLLIPYLIAALFLPLFYFAIDYFPVASQFVNSNNFNENFSAGWLRILYRLYVDAGKGTPLGFHLWFLRDLIEIVILSPLIHIFRRRLKSWLILSLLFLLTYLFCNTFFISLFWFVAGSLFLNKIKLSGGGSLMLVVGVYFFLGATELMKPSVVWSYFRLPITVLGVVAFWNVYDSFVKQTFALCNHKLMSIACSYTFFIYLYHEPVINILRKILVIPFGHSSFSFAFSYLISPWIFSLVAILIGITLRKFSPSLYNILCGGR